MENKVNVFKTTTIILAIIVIIMGALLFVRTSGAGAPFERTGKIVVGKDIDAGVYNVIAGDYVDDKKPEIYFYTTEKEFAEYYYFNYVELEKGEEVRGLAFRDGDILGINGSVFFTKTN